MNNKKTFFLSAFCTIALCAATIPEAFSDSEGYSGQEWNFITRNGNTLINNGKVFRFAGMNIHWLGIDDKVNGTYPTFQRIDEAFDMAQAMKATVVRAHTLGVSVGCKVCVEPALNQWNETAFKTIDYAIASAHKHNIRLIIPLVDNWHYYHGGKHTFTEWEGLSKQDDFYSNAEVIQDFKDYISHILEHKNQFTGIKLKNDPTIMAWETGNELGTDTGNWDDSWTENIALYIKSIAPRQLIHDGHRSEYNAKRNLTESQLRLPDVDMYTGHFYPPRVEFMKKDAELARKFGKVYFVGEYDWTDQDAVPAMGSVSQDNSEKADGQYSAHVNIAKSNPTNGYYIQLGQGGLSLVASQAYRLSFLARASTARTIVVQLHQAGYPYNTYFDQKVNLTPEWQTYTYIYTPQESYSPVTLWYNLAQAAGDVWLDNVSLQNGNINMLRNGSFEQAGNKWLSPWSFQVKQGADTLSDFLPAIEHTPGVSGDLFWQLYGHYDDGEWARGDKYTLYYPGTTQEMRDKIIMLSKHAKVMSQ